MKEAINIFEICDGVVTIYRKALSQQMVDF